MRDCPSWVLEDTGVDFNTITGEGQQLYFSLLGIAYGNKAQEQWNSEWLGKGKAKAKTVSSLVGTTNGCKDSFEYLRSKVYGRTFNKVSPVFGGYHLKSHVVCIVRSCRFSVSQLEICQLEIC